MVSPKCMRPMGFLILALLLPGCASKSYQGTEVTNASFLQRAQTQQQGTLRVTAAAPDAAETKRLTGLDLYQQGIQPVWLKIENTGSMTARVATRSIDKDYFSPIEVAYGNRKAFSSQGYEDMQRWFYDNGLQRRIPPGKTRSGLVFTNRRPGTKGFNLDIFSNRQATSFTFFLPIPGFVADYSRINFATLYPAEKIRQLDETSLKTVLEQELSCCATDVTGKLNGGPFNVVLVGTPLAVRRSLLRGGWLETSIDASMARKAREHRYDEREPDAVFYMDRPDGNERLQVNLWLAPWRVGTDSVWLVQVFYRNQDKPIMAALRGSEAAQNSTFLSRFVGESVSADIDSAQRYMMQNFWYNHSLAKVGIVKGVGASTVDDPDSTYDGFGYFSKGYRTVIFLSEEAIALDDGVIIYESHRRPTEEAGHD